MNSLLRPLDAFSISPRAVAPTCYVNTLSKIRNNTDFEPCGGSSDAGAFCCHKDDICLENSICHFTSTQIVQGTSGYYVGGCTDKTFNDPACSRSCSESPRIYPSLSRWKSYRSTGEFPTQDITYSSNSNEWACCFTDVTSPLDCSKPGRRTFEALALTALSAAPSYGLSISSTQSSTVATATTTNGAPSASPAASTATQTPDPAEGLSTGAKVGIAIPLALIGLPLIAIAIIFLRRRRRRSQGQLAAPYPPPGEEAAPMYSSPAEKSVPSSPLKASDHPGMRSELGAETRSELDGKDRPAELQARDSQGKAAKIM